MSNQPTSLDEARARGYVGVDRFAYTVNDACEAMGIKRTLLYRLIRRGTIQAVKLGGRKVIPRSEIERLTHPQQAA